ncbi:MAG: hypothetical protein NT001_05665, partial [Candidatus Woesearchaeota archaeon]|nr:hypothetical protein [Candidatus Woesearchaeota archaeon]
GTAISASSSQTTVSVPATTAATKISVTKNAKFLSETSTSVTYNVSIEIVNSGGSDLTGITVNDSDIGLNRSIDLLRTGSYNISGTKAISKETENQEYAFTKANATYDSVLYQSNEIHVLIPALQSDASLLLTKSASVYSVNDTDIIYNVNLSLTNKGGSDATYANITDADYPSGYALGTLAPGETQTRNYLLAFARGAYQATHALSIAAANATDSASSGLLQAYSDRLSVVVPAIGTSASLVLDKIASFNSVAAGTISYNITLRITNNGGSNATYVNVTDADYPSGYDLGTLTAGQTVLRKYMLTYGRNSTTYYPNLAVAQSIGIDSYSDALISGNSTQNNLTVPATMAGQQLTLVKNSYFLSEDTDSVTYNLSVSIVNSGGIDLIGVVVNDSDIGLNKSIDLLRTESYSASGTKAMNKGASAAEHIFTKANATYDSVLYQSNEIHVLIPALQSDASLLLTKSASVYAMNGTDIVYTVNLSVSNKGGSISSYTNITDADSSAGSYGPWNLAAGSSNSTTYLKAYPRNSNDYNATLVAATVIAINDFDGTAISASSSQTTVSVPATTAETKISVTKNAKFLSETSTSVVYNVSVEFVNSGGSDLAGIIVNDSDIGLNTSINLTRTKSYSVSQTNTINKGTLTQEHVFTKANATYNSVLYQSNQISVLIPALQSDASLLLTKSASVYSVNSTNIIYNINLSLTNKGGNDVTFANISDSDSTPNLYDIGTLIPEETQTRNYVLIMEREAYQTILTLSLAIASATDSVSGQLIEAISNQISLIILARDDNSASLVLDKIASFSSVADSTISYNITLRLTNKGRGNANYVNITDADSDSPGLVYEIGILNAGETILESYIKTFDRNSAAYYPVLSVAQSQGIDSYSDSIIGANSSQINLTVPSAETGQQLTLIKNAYFVSENSTSATYNLTLGVVNSGGVDLSGIIIDEQDLSLAANISLNKTQYYSYSGLFAIQKEATNLEYGFFQATATVNSVQYKSNKMRIIIPGYGGPADTIVYAPAYVSASTSFDSVINITNMNPDIGLNFVVDYWITNNAETVNYTSGQRTLLVGALSSVNTTVTLTSPSSAGTYKLRASVSYIGGPDTAYDSFEVTSGSTTETPPVTTPVEGETAKRGGGGGGGGGGVEGTAVSALFDVDFTQVESKIVTGYKGDKISLSFSGASGAVSHSLAITDVKEDSIDISIRSKEVNGSIYIRETRSFDINGDGTDDLGVTLLNITQGKAKIDVKKLSGADKIAEEEGLPENIPAEKKSRLEEKPPETQHEIETVPSEEALPKTEMPSQLTGIPAIYQGIKANLLMIILIVSLSMLLIPSTVIINSIRKRNKSEKEEKEKLIDYVKKSIEYKYSCDYILKDIGKYGYSKSEIDEAYGIAAKEIEEKQAKKRLH